MHGAGTETSFFPRAKPAPQTAEVARLRFNLWFAVSHFCFSLISPKQSFHRDRTEVMTRVEEVAVAGTHPSPTSVRQRQPSFLTGGERFSASHLWRFNVIVRHWRCLSSLPRVTCVTCRDASGLMAVKTYILFPPAMRAPGLSYLPYWGLVIPAWNEGCDWLVCLIGDDWRQKEWKMYSAVERFLVKNRLQRNHWVM